ncbi:hypothetical protein HMPREF0044_1368 [Gleimia coleocanis DSM 15436]|uniref:DUF3710 domain-containing protein n=1 Tax=Gleimia coleocanis DSM 15436 TaxID=525245 RepID=C0W1S8_9ACTO|nr:DUF3710 domain-containing protein [Gleimia coleocanis]EEH63444.1 hypothetical protein HMPREF0044_1368 [Gleimia coleocanis DSM 15436]
MAWFGKKKSIVKGDVDVTPADNEEVEPLVETPDHGPYDITQKKPRLTHLDFGTLKLPMVPGMQVQPIMSDDRQSIQRLNLLFNGFVVHLLVVAAPKSGGVANDLLDQTEASFKAEGAQVERAKGRWAEELQVAIPVKSETGQDGFTPLRVTFIEGPRWVLRVDMVGAAAVVAEAFAQAATIVDEVIVERDNVPRAPLSLIQLQIPQNAKLTAE